MPGRSNIPRQSGTLFVIAGKTYVRDKRGVNREIVAMRAGDADKVEALRDSTPVSFYLTGEGKAKAADVREVHVGPVAYVNPPGTGDYLPGTD